NVGGVESFYEYRTVRSNNTFLSIVRNITEQKLTEKALADSESRFRAQYRGIPIPTYTWGWVQGDFVLVDYNDEAFCATGGAVEGLLGINASKHFLNFPGTIADFNQCWTRNEIVVRYLDHDFLLGTGKKRSKVTLVPVSRNLVMVHAEDISEQKITEEALRRS